MSPWWSLQVSLQNLACQEKEIPSKDVFPSCQQITKITHKQLNQSTLWQFLFNQTFFYFFHKTSQVGILAQEAKSSKGATGGALLGSVVVGLSSRRKSVTKVVNRSNADLGQDERFQRTRLVTFTGMVLGYAVYYFTRLSFTYVGLAMRSDLGLSMVQLGAISSLFPLAYMNSKFLSGVLSDVLGSPVLIFSLGLMCTGVLNIAFSTANTVPIFTLIWLLNGLFQGCGATPCNKMLVNWFPARSRGKWWSSWNASHNMGGFLIPLLAGGLAARYSWRAGMMGPGIIALVAGALALVFMKDAPEKVGLPSAEEWAAPRFAETATQETSQETKETEEDDETGQLWKQLLRNKFLWCMAAMHFFIYFIRQGVLNWAHFYIMDEFGVPAMEATARVSGFELGGLLGCIVAGQVSDWLISRYPQRGAAGLRAQVMVAYSLAAAAAVFTLWVGPPVALVQWISMAAFGFAIYGPQTLITMTGVETVPRRAAATAGGLLAYPAQLGSMCAGLPFALLVQNYGWGGFFPSLIGLSLISAAVITPALNTPSYWQARHGWKKEKTATANSGVWGCRMKDGQIRVSSLCHPGLPVKTIQNAFAVREGKFKEKTSRGRLQLQRISNDTKDQRGTAFGSSLLICFMAWELLSSQGQTKKKRSKALDAAFSMGDIALCGRLNLKYSIEVMYVTVCILYSLTPESFCCFAMFC